MPLPIPPLDDRSFQDLVDEAKRRIPTYCPEWTNHNVSDPGVALIELFAWMSEMILYRVNQVPDRLYLHFLNMVGISPHPPAVARADLTFLLSAELDDTVVVPAGTEVMTVADATAGVDDPVVFSTTEDLTISRPKNVAAVAVAADGTATDVWDDVRLSATAGAAVFSSDGTVPGDAFYLGFEEPLTGMLIRVHLLAEAEGIGVDPLAPPVVWEVHTDGGGWAAAQVVEDSSGGLNKPGAVDLLLPFSEPHRRSNVNNRSLFWLRVRLLPTAPDEPTYRRTPVVRGLRVAALGGTVSAEHALQVVDEDLGRSDGRPGQRFTVQRPPVLDRHVGAVGAGSLAETVRIIDGEHRDEWTEVEDFSESGPDDRHFVWDGASGEIRFGPAIRMPDGTTAQRGAIPRDGASVTVTAYRHGGGAAGNVRANSLTVLRSSIPFVSRVTNFEAARGGVDGESVAEAVERAPLTLRTGQRAVTAADYERLVRGVPGVARVRCVGASARSATVRLLVVPGGPPSSDPFASLGLTDELFERIQGDLERHRVVGTTVEVTTPYYQGVSIVAKVTAAKGRNPASVREEASRMLDAFVHPLTGGADGRGWPYDAPLTAAQITQQLEGLDGVARVEETLLFPYDLANRRRIGSGIEVLELGAHALFLSRMNQIVVTP